MNGTRFQPGQSGNPGGRPRKLREVEEAARTHTADAVATLAAVMRDGAQPAAARVSAATALLDRGWGKASQPIEGSDGGPVSFVMFGVPEAPDASAWAAAHPPPA